MKAPRICLAYRKAQNGFLPFCRPGLGPGCLSSRSRGYALAGAIGPADINRNCPRVRAGIVLVTASGSCLAPAAECFDLPTRLPWMLEQNMNKMSRRERQCPVCNTSQYSIDATFPPQRSDVSNTSRVGREWPRLFRANGARSRGHALALSFRCRLMRC